jgi:hypothetical protein
MRGKRIVISALVLMAAVYAAYPFVTVYQIRCAVRDGDTPTLTRLVDWPSVREGIKEDICDLVLDEPSGPVDSTRLPAFGASFVRGVTSGSVDREFTPEKVVRMTAPASHADDEASITWAFFSRPDRFVIDVSVGGQTEPVRAEMEFTGIRWKVNRVWIPGTLLKQGHWAA